MKVFKSTLFVLLSIVLLFASCSIEKRVHRSGYHIDWKTGNTKSTPINSIEEDYQITERLSLNEIKSVPTSKMEDKQTARLSTEPANTTSIFSVSDDSTAKNNNDCDLIIFRDGEEIEAKVIEITQKEVKYK